MKKGKKILKYSFGSLLIGGLAYLLYNNDFEKEIRNIRDKLKAHRLKWEINEKTHELIINTFVDIILNKPNVSLNEAILIFEKAKEGMTLKEFAKSKMRLEENYIKIYKPYFEEAYKIVYCK